MDNPLTLQEAKDQVAKIHYSDKWDEIDWYHLDEINERTEPPYMEEILMKEAAELYARSKYNEGAADQLTLANEHCMKLHKHVLLEVPNLEFKP